jgi:hypothetical protein
MKRETLQVFLLTEALIIFLLPQIQTPIWNHNPLSYIVCFLVGLSIGVGIGVKFNGR